MRTALRVAGAAALAGALGACAAVSGLDSYASGGCPRDCDGSDDGNSASGDAGVPPPDATTDAANVADAESDGDGATDGRSDGRLDGGTDAPSDAVAPDAGTDTVSDVASDVASDAKSDAGLDAGLEAGADASDAGDLDVGLIAFYQFDETGGTTAADSSGNSRTATLMGGATFSSGLQNNAIALNGRNEYVALPSGIVSGLTSFSICAWVDLSVAAAWSRIFDFGTGTNAYMFLTPNSVAGTLRFSITTGGSGQEQQMNAAALTTGSWEQVAVTLAANTGTLYVNGVQVAQSASMTLNPASLGSTIQDWLGRSEFAGDPYLNGEIDNFRIYNRALSAAEVQTLFAGHL